MIRKTVRRHRQAEVARRVIVCLVIFILWLTASCIIDHWIIIPLSVRLISECLLVGFSAAVAITVLLIIRRQIDWMVAAAAIEQHDRRYTGRLLTVVSESLQPTSIRGSASLCSVLESQVVELSRSMSPTSKKRGRRFIAVGLFVVAAIAIGGVFSFRAASWPLIVRQLAPLSVEAPVTSAMLRVGPGNAVHLFGEPFTITATARGLDNALPVLDYALSDSPVSSVVMPVDGSSFVFRFSTLDQPLKYRVRVAYTATPWYEIKITSPAQLKSAPPHRADLILPTVDESAQAAAYLQAMNGRGRFSPTTEPR